MTQHVMSASGNGNIEAETRRLQIQLDLAKTELESRKYQPDIKRLVDEENARIREHEERIAAMKLEQSKVEHGGSLFSMFDRVLIVAIIVILSYQMFRE